MVTPCVTKMLMLRADVIGHIGENKTKPTIFR